MSDYLNWDKYPFTVDGVNFVSYVNPNGDIAPRLARVPRFVLDQMNIGCIRELIGQVKTMTRQEILDELEAINLGYENAYMGLALDES